MTDDVFIRAKDPKDYLAIVVRSELQEQLGPIFKATKEYAGTAVLSAFTATLGVQKKSKAEEELTESGVSSNRETTLYRARATVLKLVADAQSALNEANEVGMTFAAFRILVRRILRALGEAFLDLISLDGLLRAVWKSAVSYIYRRLQSIYNVLKDAFKPVVKGFGKSLAVARKAGVTIAEKVHETIIIALNTAAIIVEGIVSNLLLAKIPVLTTAMEFIVRCISIVVSSVFLVTSSLAHLHFDVCDVIQKHAILKQRELRQAALRRAEDQADRLLQRLQDRGFRKA